MGDASPLIIAAPNDPMAVARNFIDAHYPHHSTRLLRRQGASFYAWDGTCWPAVTDADLRSTAYRWLDTAQYVVTDPKTGESTLKPWEPNRRKVGDVMEALAATAHVASQLTPPRWIADDHPEVDAREVVPMRNGLLHWPTRTLHPHTPDLWAHHALPFDFTAEPPEPKRWLEFLAQLWGDDTESIDTLQEAMGYLVSGDTSLQKILLLVGPKRSGKGTIGRVATGLLGRHNVAAHRFVPMSAAIFG
jgi:putative DNA primase/helicase